MHVALSIVFFTLFYHVVKIKVMVYYGISWGQWPRGQMSEYNLKVLLESFREKSAYLLCFLKGQMHFQNSNALWDLSWGLSRYLMIWMRKQTWQLAGLLPYSQEWWQLTEDALFTRMYWETNSLVNYVCIY